MLNRAFPDDPIVGEEDAADLRVESGKILRERIIELANETLTAELQPGEKEEWGVGPNHGRTVDQLLDAIDRGNYNGGRTGREWSTFGFRAPSANVGHPSRRVVVCAQRTGRVSYMGPTRRPARPPGVADLHSLRNRAPSCPNCAYTRLWVEIMRIYCTSVECPYPYEDSLFAMTRGRGRESALRPPCYTLPDDIRARQWLYAPAYIPERHAV